MTDKVPDKMDLKEIVKYLNKENNKLLDIIIDLKRNFDRDNRCSICLGNVLCNVVIPCGHLCLCNSNVCLNTVKSIFRYIVLINFSPWETTSLTLSV